MSETKIIDGHEYVLVMDEVVDNDVVLLPVSGEWVREYWGVWRTWPLRKRQQMRAAHLERKRRRMRGKR